MKAVIFSHGHPTFNKGGGELAAYYIWKGINSKPEHEAWFVGRGMPEVMPKFATLCMMGEKDYLIAGNAQMKDITATISYAPDSNIADFLRKIDPDVVHLHHYINIGLELIRMIKNVCPKAKIVVTLHEYIAICMHNGQMIKKNSRQLCHRSSPRECHLCFPDISQEDFFLREQYIKSFFRLVDVFISPSRFLKNRYVAWGLPEEKILVIENGLPMGEKTPLRELPEGEVRGRFAYFGQINPFKGVDVLLEAFDKLPGPVKKNVTLDIFGSSLENQTEEYQKKVHKLLKSLKENVRLHGPYEQEELPRIMEEVDWVVMSSIWWENSPLVIQEAYKFGRPLICPDIGGMAEKVIDGVTGLHFRARDSVSLASVIQKAVSSTELYDKLTAQLPEYPNIDKITDIHLDVYKKLMSGE